ncbi:MAG TPA: TCR/Tet family MFS transporter [Chitinophagaceae bacterium]|nr:TCR/Tet family MFS transporter [Chitinophagaceae bacterium]
MSTNASRGLVFIFITLLIDIMGWGLIIPVMPKLLEEMKHVDASAASTYGSWLLIAYAATQFLFAPLVGNLSDRYGRRPVLLASLVGFGIDYIVLALSPTYEWLFVGRVIAGVTGASFTTAAAFIADISTDENRTKNFGLIGAAFGVGFILGPLLGGLLGSLGTRAPFYAAALLCGLNFLYGFFSMPESLPKEKRREFQWKRANPFGSLKFLTRHRELAGLTVCFFLIYMAAQAVQGNWSFFTQHRFQWSESMIGFSLAAIGLLVGVVQAGLTRVVNPKLGNEKSIYIGLGLYTLGLILFAFASETWMMFVFLIPYCLGGICGPALQAVIAVHVPNNEQGELQGALTSLMSLTTIFGPLVMTGLFRHFSKDLHHHYFPGAPFMAGAIFMLASTVIAFMVLTREKKEHPELRNAIAGPGEAGAPPVH